MPYKSQQIKLPESLDRRIKIPKSEHSKIKLAHESGMAIRAIARVYGVDHRTIQFILFPERLVASRKNHDWKNYYKGGEGWAAIMREHRRYKQELFKKGLLITPVDRRVTCGV